MYKKIFIIVGFFSVYSCTKDKGDIPTVVVPDSCAVNTKYSIKVKSIINTHCAVSGCHNNPYTGQNGFDFSDLSVVQTQKDRIKIRINDSSNPMPPSSAAGNILSACEKTTIATWINNGAQNN